MLISVFLSLLCYCLSSYNVQCELVGCYDLITTRILALLTIFYFNKNYLTLTYKWTQLRSHDRFVKSHSPSRVTRGCWPNREIAKDSLFFRTSLSVPCVVSGRLLETVYSLGQVCFCTVYCLWEIVKDRFFFRTSVSVPCVFSGRLLKTVYSLG